MRAVFVLLACACGSPPSHPLDAGTDGTSDADIDADAPSDADPDAPMVTSITIGGSALGVRGTVVLTLTASGTTQHVPLNDDGAFVFPAAVPAGSSFSVTTATASCDVVGGSGTDVQADVTNVQLFCGGVVELASIAFASGAPAVPFASILTPAFDPGATAYSGTRPFFMDDTDMISVTPTAVYPSLATISVYADPTTSGEASPPHVLGAAVPVRLQHAPAHDRTYEFTLVPAKPVQTTLLQASTPAASDGFGHVALAGDVLVVGAPNRGGTGAAFVMRRAAAAWTEEQVIQPTASTGAKAGTAVAIDGDVLVIGAPSDATDGRAYVYRYNATSQAWVLDGGGVLVASKTDGASCGLSVAISGTQIAVGCPGEKGTGNATGVGAVYFFRYDAASSAWVSDGTFEGASAGDELGFAVALSGTTAVVGAPHEDDGTTSDAGGVHVFVRGASTWSQQGSTLRGDRSAGARFGQAVAISGDRAVVGAPGMSTGFAYVFQRSADAWSLDGPKLAPVLIAALPEIARFGEAVAIDATHLVIGAPFQDTAVADSGSARVYRRDASGWSTSHAIEASVPSASRFGASVALDGEWCAVGAPEDSTGAAASGAVHVFR